jgi:hypothetical protein
MAIKTGRIEAHWNYFLAIENDLDRLSRYIEFDESNFNCFSIEISRILLASSAEVDVVCKQLCKKINSQSSAETINQYRDEIKGAFPNIPNFKVVLPRYGLELKPWDNWNDINGIPDWWTAYNKIKHQRDSEYHRANLRNAINSVAGLFVVTIYLYKEKAKEGELFPNPQLLRVTEEHINGFDIILDSGIAYKL